jgi:hypothetical protein
MQAVGKGTEALKLLKGDVAKACVPQTSELVNLQLDTAKRVQDWETMATLSSRVLLEEYV